MLRYPRMDVTNSWLTVKKFLAEKPLTSSYFLNVQRTIAFNLEEDIRDMNKIFLYPS